MNPTRFMKSSVLLLGLLGMLSTLAYADRNDRDRHDRGSRHEQRNIQPPPKGYLLDKRYSQNRYYPRPGYNVNRLPPKAYAIPYGRERYYFSAGIWYRPVGPRFVVTAPPIGVVVPLLPPFYATVWLGGTPYYYANDTYYLWDATRDGYVVTNPPAELTSQQQQPPLVLDQLYIYPKQGQSEQQQADDRYACHAWGIKQSSYDPTQPPSGLSQAELNSKRMDYQRAMKACLEGKGYSVR